MDEKPKRRWFRFRLSTILILTAIAAWAMATRPYWIYRYEEGNVVETRRHFRPELPEGASIVRHVTRSSPPHLFSPGLTVEIYYWKIDESRINPQLLWPALALAAFVAWKAVGLGRTKAH